MLVYTYIDHRRLLPCMYWYRYLVLEVSVKFGIGAALINMHAVAIAQWYKL